MAFVFGYLPTGLMKMGVQTAYINYNLRATSLVQCLIASDATVLIVGEGTVI
jgi:hypothetical protein